MYFSSKEKQAIVLMALNMQKADGIIDEKETLVNKGMFLTIQLSSEEFKSALNLPFGEAISILSDMSDNKKEVVSAFLGALMAVDGDIDDKELLLWNFVSAICSFPIMTIEEAIATFQQYINQ